MKTKELTLNNIIYKKGKNKVQKKLEIYHRLTNNKLLRKYKTHPNIYGEKDEDMM